MRAECPPSHESRRGTHAECGDCPFRQRRNIAQHVMNAASLPAIPDEPQPTAEVAVRDAHSPALITDQAREQAARIIAEAMVYQERVITRHVQMRSQADLDTVMLWNVAHNARERTEHGPGQLIWSASARLGLTSSQNQSGKSSLLDLEAMLVGSRFGRIQHITAPGFAKLMSEFQEAACLDEVKLLFGRGEQSRILQGMILAGYTPRVSTFNARAGGTAENLFGAVAYAAKDDFITAAAGDSSIGDMLSRTIMIHLDRATRFHPEIDEQAEGVAGMAQRGMSAWGWIMAPELRAAARRLSQEAAEAGEQNQADIDNGLLRRVQLYRQLIACADVMGGTWPERARTLASAGSELEGVLAGMGRIDIDGMLGKARPVTFTEGNE